MTDKCSRFFVGVFVFSLARVGVAGPEQDTPIARQTTVQEPVERRLLEWSARQGVGLSFSVARLPEGQVLAQHEGTVLRNPASVSKLFTSMVALRRLGAAYRFKTTLHGLVEGDRVRRLVIRGQGDPSLTSDAIQAMAGRLSAMGVTRVEEPIVVDQAYFDDRFVPPAFDQQPNEWSPFRAPVCATALDGNSLTLRIWPAAAGRPARAFVEPMGAAALAGEVRSVEGDTKAGRIRMSIVPGPERPSVRIGGEIGEREPAFSLARRVDDPRKMVGQVLRWALVNHGIDVPEEVRTGAGDNLPVLLARESEPLAVLLPRIGKDSDNFTAEMLLKGIAAKVTGVGSSEAGARIVSEYVETLGVIPGSLRFVNGSGLFDANRATTGLLVRLLADAYSNKSIAPEFLAQLSIAGQDGTLTKRLRTLPAGCLVRAKTGSLRGTTSLAGYLERPDGATLAFAVLAEKVKEQTATRAQIDRFVEGWCRAPMPSSATP